MCVALSLFKKLWIKIKKKFPLDFIKKLNGYIKNINILTFVFFYLKNKKDYQKC